MISASDQNSNIPSTINEISETCKNLFTMTTFTEMTHIYDRTKIAQNKRDQRIPSDCVGAK